LQQIILEPLIINPNEHDEKIIFNCNYIDCSHCNYEQLYLKP